MLKIHLITKIYNEERILPLFFRHYDQYVEKYWIWNHGSTDRTRELCEANSKVTLFNLPPSPFDEGDCTQIRNVAWKEHVPTDADFVFIFDSDEFIYHPDLLGLLERYKKEGVTIPKIEGYQMYSDSFIETDKQIYEVIKKGRRAENYDKHGVIHPSVSPNYSYGAHFIYPTGDTIKFSDTAEIKLLHYKIFGQEFVDKMMQRNNILSEHNKLIGASVYSLDPNAKFNPLKEYELVKQESVDVV